MSKHYRCSTRICRKRVAFKKGQTIGVCPKCHNDTLRRDKSHENESRRLGCTCDATHHKHRKGSYIYCTYYTGPLTDNDYQEFQDSIIKQSRGLKNVNR
jgi:hypothetical protein